MFLGLSQYTTLENWVNMCFWPKLKLYVKLVMVFSPFGVKRHKQNCCPLEGVDHLLRYTVVLRNLILENLSSPAQLCVVHTHPFHVSHLSVERIRFNRRFVTMTPKTSILISCKWIMMAVGRDSHLVPFVRPCVVYSLEFHLILIMN